MEIIDRTVEAKQHFHLGVGVSEGAEEIGKLRKTWGNNSQRARRTFVRRRSPRKGKKGKRKKTSQPYSLFVGKLSPSRPGPRFQDRKGRDKRPNKKEGEG